ncbi:hypothetical protein BN2476_170226 [Paraburkholderia piptadeniae]|uniref:Uncharacterized protein n=1 Tax=Paraburkholderia piptadeniae TaxID=1701573 RepID=A0A1N7RU39_9BURK|nr:hypothetical protein BN2476_170226 [Paraburkholderia piptadeniae]
MPEATVLHCIAASDSSIRAIRIWRARPPRAALHVAEERTTFALEPLATLSEAVLAEVPAQTVRSTARRHNDARSFFVSGSSE